MKAEWFEHKTDDELDELLAKTIAELCNRHGLAAVIATLEVQKLSLAQETLAACDRWVLTGAAVVDRPQT